MANDEIEDGGGGDGGGSEPAGSSDINLTAFLTDVSPLNGAGFSLASGIKVTRVAQAAIATVVFAIGVNVNRLIGAVTDQYARLLDGLSSFFGVSLVEATLGVGVAAIEGSWSFALNEFGLLAYPMALVSILATFYVVERGFGTAQEVLR